MEQGIRKRGFYVIRDAKLRALISRPNPIVLGLNKKSFCEYFDRYCDISYDFSVNGNFCILFSLGKKKS